MIIIISEDAGLDGFATVLNRLSGFAVIVTTDDDKTVTGAIQRTVPNGDDAFLELDGWDEQEQDYRTPVSLSVSSIKQVTYL